MDSRQNLGFILAEAIEAAGRDLEDKIKEDGSIDSKDLADYYTLQTNNMFQYLTDNNVRLSTNGFNVIMMMLAAFTVSEKESFKDLPEEVKEGYKQERQRVMRKVVSTIFNQVNS